MSIQMRPRLTNNSVVPILQVKKLRLRQVKDLAKISSGQGRNVSLYPFIVCPGSAGHLTISLGGWWGMYHVAGPGPLTAMRLSVILRCLCNVC